MYTIDTVEIFWDYFATGSSATDFLSNSRPTDPNFVQKQSW